MADPSIQFEKQRNDYAKWHSCHVNEKLFSRPSGLFLSA